MAGPAALLYGSGLRLMECLRLRVGDIDLERLILSVGAGKGGGDRRAPLPEKTVEVMRARLSGCASARRPLPCGRESRAATMLQPPLKILRLYVSPAHNYFGHHGKPPGGHPTREVDRAQCVPGRGIEGDRFFGYKDNYKGQITFFAHEVYARLCEELDVHDRSPAVFRRNVLCEGFDLNELIGKEFELQGVRFRGREECRPCYWMDEAFGPGAEAALRGRGGLRAEILTPGALTAEQG